LFFFSSYSNIAHTHRYDMDVIRGHVCSKGRVEGAVAGWVGVGRR
jgi:hypothetical protein